MHVTDLSTWHAKKTLKNNVNRYPSRIRLVFGSNWVRYWVMITTNTLAITPELLDSIAEIDEFNSAWQALGTSAPECVEAFPETGRNS